MVEMMAVLAVITILALMAVPSYLDRVVKAQIDAALPLTDLAKRAVATYWTATGEMPVNNAAAALPVADKIVGNFVSAVTVAEGAIHITFGNRASKAINGKVLTLRPAVVEDAPVVPIAWVCGFAEAPAKMTALGQNETNIESALLPMDCRSLTPR
jgi:type IV pilus assembly protein PilA